MYYLARTQMLSDYSYPESLQLASRLGFDGAEISFSDKDFNIRSSFFDKEVISAMKNEVTKMKIASVSCHSDYVNSDKNLEMIIKSFSVARELGIDIVIINGAVSKAENKKEKKKEWQKMISRTSHLCQEAEKYNIRLAKEFEPNFITSSTEDLLKVFAEVNSPNLFANIDLGHVFLCDPRPMKALEMLEGKIIHGHIENMNKEKHDHLVPYKGDMDLQQYINKLRAIEFDGPLALDLYKYDYEEVSKKSLEYLKNL